jgi:glutamate dehydrogenase
VARLEYAAVPTALAANVASMAPLLSALDVVEIAHATRRSVDAVAAVHFQLGARQQLHWLRDRIVALPRDDRWQALARSALRDDLNTIHRALAFQVLQASSPELDVNAAIDAWAEGNSTAVRRSLRMLADIQASRTYDLTTLPVALREVRNLVQSTDLPSPDDASD